jgi:hypothetical protein
MIRFYLRRGADPQRTCRPGMLRKPTTCAYVLEHLPELVVKEVHGSGGYGMLVGPASTRPRSRSSAPRSSPRRTTTSRSRRCRCRPARPSSTRHRAAPHRPAPLRALGQGRQHGARRPDPRRAARKARWWSIPRRAAAPRTPGCWRTEGEPCIRPQTTSTGWRAAWSAPRTPRACSTSPTACRCCPQTVAERTRMARDAVHQRPATRISRRATTAQLPPERDATSWRSTRQPVSIYNSLRAARENARAMRGVITSEMWEALNATWLEMRG